LTIGKFGHWEAAAGVFAELGAMAERLLPVDPASAVVKLLHFSEAMTQNIAALMGIVQRPESQLDLLSAVSRSLRLDLLGRQLGKCAAQEAGRCTVFRQDLQALNIARELSVWYARTFCDPPGFEPGPFVVPDCHSQKAASSTGLTKVCVAKQDTRSSAFLPCLSGSPFL
jgi:type I restriction enzyme R subunit